MTKDTEALREAVEQVKQLAQRDMARTQTDFLGRMGQELCDFEAAIEPYPDGELPDDVRGDAYDAISGLAGLAFAQMLMLRGCDHTIFATPASDVAPVEYETLIAAGFDEYAAHCALRTEPDGGFCHAYFYSDGQWRFQTGGNDLTLADGTILRCVLTKRLFAHPPLAQSVDPVAGEALREGLTDADWDRAQAETDRLTRELDIANADHIALWLEANMADSPLAWLACRIVEAHEAALAALKGPAA